MKLEQSPARLEPGRAAVTLGATSPELHDCWNKIGVRGDGSCAELAKHIHCRNCPVFSQAGAQLLDRAPSPEHQREWTEHFAEPKAEKALGKLSLVVFRIGSEWFALPTPILQEVAESRSVHSLPHRRRSVVLGLVNIRGELLICVSVGRLLGLERDTRKDKPRTSYERLVVASWNGQRLVFPVDEVGGIQRCHPHEFKEVPATVSKAAATFARGILSWKDKSVGCLDEELLFTALHRNLT